jgi:hypothetical protein
MMNRKKNLDPAKLRTRHDPPTLEEAVFAAQGLTGDFDQQVLIAARLIGMPEHEVRPAVLSARSTTRATHVRVAGAHREVVVEHKGQRTSLQARRSPAPFLKG